MKTYFRAFINFKQDDWARVLLMTKFVYNNAKNNNIGHMLFELNCKYHLCVFYKENVNLYSKSMFTNELLSKLQKQ